MDGGKNTANRFLVILRVLTQNALDECIIQN